jgi:hypothetical protein
LPDNPSKMTESEFHPHGDFLIRRDGQVLVSEVTGPWNAELVALWAKQIYPYARELAAQGPHAGIAIVRQSMVTSPEALAKLRQIVAYSVANLRCVAHVIVADRSVEGRSLLEPVFAKVYEGLCAHRLFEDYDPARAWVQALLTEQQKEAP